MSSRYPLNNPLRRMRSLTAAMGVLSELDSAHTLTGYTVTVRFYDGAPKLRIWGLPESMADIFTEEHADEWYADPPQRNLTRTIRGVEVSTIQNRADYLRIQAAREEAPRLQPYNVAEWEAGYNACEAGDARDSAGTPDWSAGWRAADDELHRKVEATS